MLNTRTGEYDFTVRSIPRFPQNDLDVPAGEKAYVKVKAPFCDKLYGMICRNDKAVRILDLRSIGYCKAQPRCALLGYPFCNMAHTEATPTREGI